MRALTGSDELLFLNTTGQTAALIGLATALTGRTEADLRAQPLADWEEVLITLRSRLIGPRIEAELRCPDCGASIALIFNASDLPREVPPVPAGLRPLTAGDLADLEDCGLRGEAALAFLLARAQPGTLSAPQDPADHLAGLEVLASGLGLDLATACTDCGVALVSPFDIAAFFGAEMAGLAARLLDEIHLIAGRYHWAEDAILALPFARRQAYITRILAEPLALAARPRARA